MQPPGSRRQVRVASPSPTEIKSDSQRSRAYDPWSPKLLYRQSVSQTPQKQMCRREQFDVVYPNRCREQREQLVPCHRRTHGQPCRGAEVVRLKDRLGLASEQPPIQPHIVPIEPRDLGNSRRHSSSRERKREPITGVTLNFKFWNPFSSKKKERDTRFHVVRKRMQRQPHPAVIHIDPPIAPPPVAPPSPPRPPSVVHSSEEDEDESSSPPEANRRHRRRTRSLSRIRRYEAEKERIRQRELRERERRERNTREERKARDRAARLERERADEERERVASLERHERRERRRERAERREREEHRQAQLRERHAAEQEAIRQARIQQEREDHERRRAARRAQQIREDIARRRWEEQERARYRYAEQRRRDRAWQANIPRYPRHPVFVHHDDLDRGDRVIRDDIEAENLRRFDRRAERLRGGYDDGWLRRRNTVDGGRRRYDGYWRDRY